MASALVIGGTGFVGRHAAENLLEHGYDVASLSRGEPEAPIFDPGAVEHLTGDRTDRAAIERVAARLEPDVVIDCAAFVLYHHPATGYPHVLDTCKIRALGW